VYRKVEPTPSSAQDFKLRFEGKLAATNRWVQLAELIPWSEFESEYAQNFVAEVGPPAKSFRLALGALIIKEKLGISDARNRRANSRESLPATLSVIYPIAMRSHLTLRYSFISDKELVTNW